LLLKKILIIAGLHFLLIGRLFAQTPALVQGATSNSVSPVNTTSNSGNVATYYVSPTGNDSNNGTSPNAPWQTIAKVNGTTYIPGDTVLFQGGQIFTGNLQFTVRATSTEPFTIGSYGTGHAVISAGAGTGLSAYNCSGFVVQHIDFIGSGVGTNTNSGIVFYADLSGNVALNYICINDVQVSGFGQEGIGIGSWNNLTGYTDVRVRNAMVHDNRDGMQVYAQTKGANRNVYVGFCQFYHNPGIAGLSHSSGSGVVLGEVNGGAIEYCQSYNNGASNTSSTGPAGIWCYDSSSILVQYNESYRNTTAGGDGDGFDLDGGTSNSYLQHNYSHDNHGSGYCLFEYSGAGAHTGNTVRYNISENDSSGVEIWGADGGSLVSSDNIYGNIVSTGRGPQIYFVNSNCDNIAFAQNIIVSSSGQSLISFPGSSGVSFADDDYWTNGAAFTILWGGKTYSSLSSWQAATGQGSGAQSTNPSPFAGSPIFCWSTSNH
jgi:hypothetical protein